MSVRFDDRDAAAGNAGVADIWYTRCPVPTASSLAIDHGWLEREFAPDEIRIASLRASSDQAVRESHFDHSQENSFRQGGSIPPMWTRAQGGATRLVAISWVLEYQAVIALPRSGIRTVKDLKGRRLGVPRRVNDRIDYWRAMCLKAYEAALALGGLNERDVEFVDLPIDEKYIGTEAASARGTLWAGGGRARRQQQDAFALVRGTVDAIYTAGAPGAWLAAFLGAEDVVELGRHSEPSVRINNQNPVLLTVSASLCETRPDLVARYLRCLAEAAVWAETHPNETRRIVANDVGAPEEWVDAANGADYYKGLALVAPAAGLDALEAQKAFLVRRGFIARDFDLGAWIDPRPLGLAGLGR